MPYSSPYVCICRKAGQEMKGWEDHSSEPYFYRKPWKWIIVCESNTSINRSGNIQVLQSCFHRHLNQIHTDKLKSTCVSPVMSMTWIRVFHSEKCWSVSEKWLFQLVFFKHMYSVSSRRDYGASLFAVLVILECHSLVITLLQWSCLILLKSHTLEQVL